MSSTSSAVLADTPSDSRQLDLLERSSSARSTHSDEHCSSDCSPQFRATTTLEPFAQSEDAPSSSSEVRPVSVPASAPLSMENGMGEHSGPRCCESFTTFARNGLSWSSPRETRNGKPRCHTIWQQLAGTMPDLNSRLQTLVRLVYAGECSFLPSPVSRDWRSPGLRSHERLKASRGQPLPEVFGVRVHPELCEWLMGLPIGWTAMLPSKPSVTRTRRK